MTESSDNVVYICKECSEERRSTFQKRFHEKKQEHVQAINDRLLHGQPVFIKFEFKDGDISEHMWVDVKAYDVANDIVTGVLDNDPFNIKNVRCGDTVKMSINSAESIL